MKILALLLFLPALAGAVTLDIASFGAISGGGGKGVVCRDSSGAVTSVKLLDIWEGETLYGLKMIPTSGNLAADVETAVQRLKNSYLFQGSLSDLSGNYEGQDALEHWLRGSAAQFLNPNSTHISRLRGANLTLTDDSLELATPVNCPPEQIVNYQPTGNTLINQDLFDKLDEPDQAALIAHETFYSFLRAFASEKNSIRTRRAVAAVFSGYVFSLAPTPAPAASLICTAGDASVPNSLNVLRFYSRGQNAKGFVQYDMYAEFLNGTKLIGMTNPPFAKTGGYSTDSEFMFQGTCRGDTGLSGGFEGNGPVEKDRLVVYNMNCSHGQFTFDIESFTPGEPESKRIPMTCKYVSAGSN